MALTRRRLLATLGAGGVAVAAGGSGYALGHDAAPPAGDDQVVPFHGATQAGIATPAQDRLHFAAFDLAAGTGARDLRELMRAWSAAAATMTRGRPLGGAAGTARPAGGHRRDDRPGRPRGSR